MPVFYRLQTPQAQRQQTHRRKQDFAASAVDSMKNSPRPKAATAPWKQDFAASARDPMKPTKHKGSNRALEAGFCCLRRRLDETHQDQRQQTHLKKQDFAASAVDPMKHAKCKGSNHTSESRICCLRLEPDETHQDQRQQSRLGSRILLPPP